MFIEQVTSYQTTDGKTFTDINAAKAHQKMLENKEIIDRFADTMPNPRQASNARRVVGAYLAFLDTPAASGEVEAETQAEDVAETQAEDVTETQAENVAELPHAGNYNLGA